MRCVLVKVQFRGAKLYKKKRAPFQEESYLPRIIRSSSLNLHTFYLINILFWWQIFYHMHGKLTPNDRQHHHVLVVDVVIMMSQCRCTRALSQSHVAKHNNHVPVTPLIGSGTGCHVDAMAVVWQNHIGKNIKITFKIEAIHLQSYRQLVHEGMIPGRHNSSWNSSPFLLKSLGPLNWTFAYVFAVPCFVWVMFIVHCTSISPRNLVKSWKW